jgi:hypothetical protein
MRLCVIGNSHVGALKLGCSDGDVTFFASHARTLRTLYPKDGCLVSDQPDVRKWLAFTSGGQDSIRVADYDAFLIAGCGLGLPTLGMMYETHRLSKHATGGEQIISAAALEQAVAGLVRYSLATRVADLVRQLTDAPIAILPDPLPAPWIVQKHQPWLADEDIRRTLTTLYREQVVQIPHPVLEQPASTVDGDFTKEEFSRGSLKLLEYNRRHAQDEPYHMNADYGAAAMADAIEYFARLAEESPSCGHREIVIESVGKGDESRGGFAAQ